MLLKVSAVILVHTCALVFGDFDIHSHVPHQTPDLKIIKGNDAPKDSHPFMVYIVFDTQYCGGSLISPQHVLTAAHCATSNNNIYALLGVHNIQLRNEPSRYRINGTAYTAHPKYNKDSASHDIAVVKLQSRAPTTLYIQLVQLPPRSAQNNPANYWANKDATAYGWGRTQMMPIIRASVLQMLEVKVLAPTDNLCYIYNVPTDSVCITRRDGGQGNVCKGDSGSPLMVNGVQIGVVHGHIGYPCEIAKVATYARVDWHLDWIYQTMASL